MVGDVRIGFLTMEFDFSDLVIMGVAVALLTAYNSRLLARAGMRGLRKRSKARVIYFSVSSLVCCLLCALRILSGLEFTLNFCIICGLKGLWCGAGVVFAILLYYDQLERSRKNGTSDEG